MHQLAHSTCSLVPRALSKLFSVARKNNIEKLLWNAEQLGVRLGTKIHTHSHSCTHTYTHMHTHIHVHALTHTHTLTHTHSHSHSHTHSRALLRTMVLLWLSSTLRSGPLTKCPTQALSLRCSTWSPRTRWALETDPSLSCASKCTLKMMNVVEQSIPLWAYLWNKCNPIELACKLSQKRCLGLKMMMMIRQPMNIHTYIYTYIYHSIILRQ